MQTARADQEAARADRLLSVVTQANTHANQESARADREAALRRRADQEKATAAIERDEEKARADKEKDRADQEKQRADRDIIRARLASNMAVAPTVQPGNREFLFRFPAEIRCMIYRMVMEGKARGGPQVVVDQLRGAVQLARFSPLLRWSR